MPIDPELAARHGLKQTGGVEVFDLSEDGTAQNAGVWIEDIISGFGDQRIESIDDLQKLLMQLPLGERTSITLLREGKRIERIVTRSDYPLVTTG